MGIALGLKRLSILDLSNRGHQPMLSRDGRFALVFNGEVYNFRDIRRVLEAEGHTFVSDCDSEVVLHAYMEWGKLCIHRFRGMFAFAVWDGATGV